jgi:hypothetical protein
MNERTEGEIAHGAARVVNQVVNRAKSEAAGFAADVRRLSREAAFVKQLRAAECACCLEAVSLDAAAALRRSRYPHLAGHAERLARLSDTAAVYLSQTAPEDVWFDTRACIRRHPASAFTAFLLGGLLIGRFLRNSARGEARFGSRY